MSDARAIDLVNASLKRRYAAERRFKLLGLSAVILGLSFVLLLFGNIIAQGWTAFAQTYIQLPVQFDAAEIDPDGTIAGSDLTPEAIAKETLRVNFNKLARNGLKSEFPAVSGRRERRALYHLISPGAPQQLRQMVSEDPSLIGSERSVWLLADDDVDMFMKGRSTPVDRISPEGTATPSAASGEVRISSSSADFDLVRASLTEHLQRQADQHSRELERLERTRAEIADQRAQLQARLEQTADSDAGSADVLESLRGRLERLDDREDDVVRSIERTAAELTELESTIAAGAENLDDEMPSWLVRINGGLVKLQTVSPTAVTGEALVPLTSTAAAAPQEWELLELPVPETDRRLKDQQVAWVMTLDAQGRVEKRFNTLFFTNGSSREPELAGIAGALMGSFYTLLLTLLFSFPIAVGTAVYLEEFAPKNRLTDLIEVNINNLAAVPSIVFGLLGLAVFINFFGVPRSTPLVAAMVLTLMTLPTIIIASRAALKSVPPSIREAALGVGASPLQTQVHHVLPLALPGMLTGTIIGMAQALGETAPLLMIGMIAFIVDIPQGFTDPATVLPVQVFLWADSPERGFVERTSAAIMVLLAFLILMNLTAVLLRRRFERRW